ncbi:MAG: nucleotidyl transferase AbiEii/AbiGii toxin family protein, partial [bacterium]|nr:nucleotidyl transferase AbiEii/AbiGii toxin family protein [bacterium]
MEALKKIIKSLPAEAVWNTAREYLQVLTLKLIYQSAAGHVLSFMGGTSLRICYDLKRYSEDLDFALDDTKRPYSFSRLMEHLQKELRLLGFDVAANVHEDKIVQKAFLKFAGLPQALGLQGMGKEQKLHIKLEVDIRPPLLGTGDRESFFVNRFGEIFPILKHTLPTL